MGLLGARPCVGVVLPVVCADTLNVAAAAKTNEHTAFLMLDAILKSNLP
jgi:hypothetical protein